MSDQERKRAAVRGIRSSTACFFFGIMAGWAANNLVRIPHETRQREQIQRAIDTLEHRSSEAEPKERP